jgi:hypothetical protein
VKGRGGKGNGNFKQGLGLALSHISRCEEEVLPNDSLQWTKFVRGDAALLIQLHVCLFYTKQ